MEMLYHYTGLCVVWIIICFIAFKVLSFILIGAINIIGDRFNNAWAFIEFLYYRKQFKDFVKDKDRHPRMKKIN